jgi:hypothetical protein
VELELLAGRIRGPEPDDVRFSAQTLAALRPLHDSVVGVDLRGADDVVSRSAPAGADVRGVEVLLDHGSCRRFVHRNLLPGRSLVLGGGLSGRDNFVMSAPRGAEESAGDGAVSDADALSGSNGAQEREDQRIAALELAEPADGAAVAGNA